MQKKYSRNYIATNILQKIDCKKHIAINMKNIANNNKYKQVYRIFRCYIFYSYVLQSMFRDIFFTIFFAMHCLQLYFLHIYLYILFGPWGSMSSGVATTQGLAVGDCYCLLLTKNICICSKKYIAKDI